MLSHGRRIFPRMLTLSIAGANNHDLPNVTPPVLVVALALLRKGLRVEQYYGHLISCSVQLLYPTTAPNSIHTSCRKSTRSYQLSSFPHYTKGLTLQ